jgi:AraC-like DNA-binding protein
VSPEWREHTLKAYFTHSDPIVPMQHPTALVELAVSRGVSRDAVLKDTGITPQMLESSDARISYVQFGKLSANALEHTGETGLGLDLGRRLHLGNLGVLGLAIMTSRTVGAALDVALQYYRALAPAWDITLSREGNVATLTARPAISMGSHLMFATEAILATFQAQGEFLIGRPVPIFAVRVGYPAPRHADRYRQVARAPVTFGHEVSEADFDASILEERVRWSDPVTANQAARQCEAVLPTEVGPDGLVARVRRHLSAARGDYPSESGLAHALRTSPRTLRRGLHRMRTSYQALLDDDRRVHAVALLRTTSLTAEAIAKRLGFSDVRSFRRAFKRWTGKAPSAYRAERVHALEAS